MEKLTKRVVDAAKPRPERFAVWDSELRGFGCVVHPPSTRRPAGSRVYVIDYATAEGRRRRMKLGEHGELTADQARRLAAENLARVRAGEDPLAKRHEARSAPTVAEVCDTYLEARRPRWKPGTYREVKRVLDVEVKGSAIGSRKVSAVTRTDVEKLHAAYQAAGRPTMGNRVLAWLSGVFQHAERTGARPDGSNPCRNVERHPEGRRERAFSLAELQAIGEALAARPAKEAAAVDAIRLLALTGLRRNEVLRLRWAEVDFERKLLRLEETKTGARLKALGPAALALLKRRHEYARKGAEYVFPARRGEGPMVDMRRTIAAVYAAAKVENASAHHVWRHTFTTHAGELGFSELLIAAMVGHRLSSMTSRYAHLTIDGAVRAADEKVQAHLAAALDGGSAKREKVTRLRRGKR